VVPKISSPSEEKSTNQTASSGAKPATIVKATILPGASAQGNPGYDPSSLNVKKGDGIEWTNKDNAPHTVTSLKDDGKSFDSQLMKASGTWTLDTSKLTGSEYDYFCTIHPHMKAKFTIGNVDAEANAKQSGAGSGQPNIKVAIPKDAQSPSASVFYEPATAQVSPGSSVVWENQDTVPHTATSGDSKKAAADKIFDTGIISPGQSSKPVTMPSKEGEIPYFCLVHPYMVGKIMVGAASPPAEAGMPPPPPPPPPNATKQT
jgi:plastocyanin